MKTSWILIGEADTRKSSTARLLTGLGRIETQVDVADERGRRFRVRSLVSAAQESRLTPQDLLAELNGRTHWAGVFDSIRNAVVLLRYDPVNNCPAGQEYVKLLLSDGWHIECVVSLGEPARDWIRSSGIRHIETPQSVSLASNEVAAIVRRAWGWQ